MEKTTQHQQAKQYSDKTVAQVPPCSKNNHQYEPGARPDTATGSRAKTNANPDAPYPKLSTAKLANSALTMYFSRVLRYSPLLC